MINSLLDVEAKDLYIYTAPDSLRDLYSQSKLRLGLTEGSYCFA